MDIRESNRLQVEAIDMLKPPSTNAVIRFLKIFGGRMRKIINGYERRTHEPLTPEILMWCLGCNTHKNPGNELHSFGNHK